MRVLITGGSGFIGNAVAKRYLAEGHEVFITGQGGENPTDGMTCLGYDPLQIDFEGLPRFDILNHQAAIVDTLCEDRDLMFKVNVEMPLELFERATMHGIPRIVYASSASVYGRFSRATREDENLAPLNVYGESKLALDREVIERGFPAIGLRYSNVYGLGESHKGRMMSYLMQMRDQALATGVVRLFGDGEQKRDWVLIHDVVDANVLADDSNFRGVLNVGSGYANSFNNLARMLGAKVEYIDNPYSERYQDFTLLDLTKAREVLGYEP